MDDDAASFVVRREMACTRAEFRTALARTVGIGDSSGEGAVIVVPLAGGAIQVEVVELPPRRLGSLALPGLAVQFTFMAVAEEARDAFLDRFDLCSRRGGG